MSQTRALPKQSRPAEALPEARKVSLSELCGWFARQVIAWRVVLAHTYVLYGGAMGGGKSRFLRWLAVRLLIRWAKQGHYNVRVGLFSIDYPTLHDRQLSKIRIEFPDWLGKFHEQTKEFRLAKEFGAGVICFRNLDDPSKYRSAEFAAILVDEMTESEESVFRFLLTRLRWPGIEDIKFVGATNPGNIGHAWCKQFFIDRDFPPELKPEADQFAYVRSTAIDNPHNAESYQRMLNGLPPSLRAAMRDGSWDVFSGQVYEEFRRDIHVPVESFPIPAWWRCWMSNDPGYTDPGVWYLLAADQDRNVYIVREWTFEKLVYEEQARQVALDLSTMGPPDKDGKPTAREYDYIVTGMDAFVAEKGRRDGKSYVDYYELGGLSKFVEPVHGAGSRRNMAATTHEYLKPYKAPDGRRVAKLRIFKECTKLIQTLPVLPADENNKEQVAECAIDHWYQAAGYGLQSLHANKSLEPEKALPAKGTIGHLINWPPREQKQSYWDDE